jgi:hypothetical protein
MSTNYDAHGGSSDSGKYIGSEKPGGATGPSKSVSPLRPTSRSQTETPTIPSDGTEHGNTPWGLWSAEHVGKMENTVAQSTLLAICDENMKGWLSKQPKKRRHAIF